MPSSPFARRSRVRLCVVACLSAGLVALAGGRVRAQAASPPAGAGSSGTTQEPLSALPGENTFPLQITGFGVVDYQADGRTKDNSFDAGKLAVSLFRELTDNVWVFGQLTTSVSAAAGGSADGEGAVTDIEIDNFIINLTPPSHSSLSFAAGRFDAPIGSERDDEPLNLQATSSFNFELARPAKMTGVIGRWAAGRRVDVAMWIANGWDSAIDPNHGKTVGARLGMWPSEHASLGASALVGPEGPADATRGRYLATFDYAYQPTPAWILAGEANYGGDRAAAGAAGARWYGATATFFRRLAERVGTTVRAEVFRDRDGARTGLRQTLTSFTVSPVYFLGAGQEGIFANIEHTTFRIPRFQLRGEVRFNRSTRPYFDGPTGPVTWTVQYVAQLVATF